jgi:hypothetical protein
VLTRRLLLLFPRERRPLLVKFGAVPDGRLVQRPGAIPATRYAKAITGLRIFLRKLQAPPTRPTETFTDAQVVIDTNKSGNATKESQWVCTRLAMTRYYEACGAGKFIKI